MIWYPYRCNIVSIDVSPKIVRVDMLSGLNPLLNVVANMFFDHYSMETGLYMPVLLKSVSKLLSPSV